MKRFLPWTACAVVLAVAAPTLARGAAGSPAVDDAAFSVHDNYFQDVAGSGSSDNEVTITAGGTVTFDYAAGAGGASHNVNFTEAKPSGCVQVTPTPIPLPDFPVPPLPQFILPAPWNGYCTFNTPGTYAFVCDAHASVMFGRINVTGAPTPTPTPTVTPTPTPTLTPTPTPTPTSTPTPTATPTPPGTRTPTPSADSHPVADADSHPPLPDADPDPHADADPAPTPTPSPTPRRPRRRRPTPTPTPTPGGPTAQLPVSGSVGAGLALRLTTPAAHLGSFVPGIARAYETTMAAEVTSSAGNAALSVSDADGSGRLADRPAASCRAAAGQGAGPAGRGRCLRAPHRRPGGAAALRGTGRPGPGDDHAEAVDRRDGALAGPGDTARR